MKSMTKQEALAALRGQCVTLIRFDDFETAKAVSHAVADGSETYSPLTLEQLQAISALAQEQGITASMSVPQGDGAAECLLVVLSGG